MKDAHFLSEAFAEARLGRGQTSPNPAVGAIVAKDGAVIGRGHHTWAGVKHAEIVALEQAGEHARGATLYTTLEPCNHTGRSGPCTEAVIAAGIKSVVVAMEDPNPLVSGSGLARLREAGLEVSLEPAFTAEATHLNEPFIHFMRTGRVPRAERGAKQHLHGFLALRPQRVGHDHRRMRPGCRKGIRPDFPLPHTSGRARPAAERSTFSHSASAA